MLQDICWSLQASGRSIPLTVLHKGTGKVWFILFALPYSLRYGSPWELMNWCSDPGWHILCSYAQDQVLLHYNILDAYVFKYIAWNSGIFICSGCSWTIKESWYISSWKITLRGKADFGNAANVGQYPFLYFFTAKLFVGKDASCEHCFALLCSTFGMQERLTHIRVALLILEFKWLFLRAASCKLGTMANVSFVLVFVIAPNSQLTGPFFLPAKPNPNLTLRL